MLLFGSGTLPSLFSCPAWPQGQMLRGFEGDPSIGDGKGTGGAEGAECANEKMHSIHLADFTSYAHSKVILAPPFARNMPTRRDTRNV